MVKEEEEVLPDHLRCSRTDGRQWRCRRRVMDNLRLCQIHYLQGRHRQYKEKVPDSLKLLRKRKNGNNDDNNKSNDDVVLENVEIRARKVGKVTKRMKKRRKSSDSSEALVDNNNNARPAKRKSSMKHADLMLDLIRMALKREVEKSRKMKQKGKRKKKRDEEEEIIEEVDECHYTEAELTRELPNGVMAISPVSSTPHDHGNVGFRCDVKVGVEYKAITPRYFRSKNVDRVPAGKLQVGFILVLML